MKNILKSWKTSLMGVIALLGLAYHAYTTGGFNVVDFILLMQGIKGLLSKDGDQSHSTKNTIGGTLPPTPPPPINGGK